MICDEQFELNTQLLLDHMLDTVLVLDDQLRIVVFNSAAESMFRYEANEMLGESVLKLVDQTHWPHVEQFLGANRATLLSGKPTELPCIRSDGKSLTVETLTSSLYTDDAEYLLTIARDVTDIKKITTRLALEHQANQLLLSSIGSLLIIFGRRCTEATIIPRKEIIRMPEITTLYLLLNDFNRFPIC